MNFLLSRGLTHRPELGASVLSGEFLPLGEDVILRFGERPIIFLLEQYVCKITSPQASILFSFNFVFQFYA